MTTRLTFILLFFCISICNVVSQEVPILDYNVNSKGQVELEIEGEAEYYYLLSAQHEPNLVYESVTSMTMGIDGNMIISEPAGAYELQNYKLTKYLIDNPGDIDNDGVDDVTEFNNMPSQAPLNVAPPVPFVDGSTSIDSYETFSEFGVIDPNIPWAPFLNNQEFVKFVIFDQNTDNPQVYFINSKTHYIHANFISTIPDASSDATTGEIVFNPNNILPNGVIGSYSFNYSFGNSYSFDHTQRTFELLVANMPYLENNMRHFIGDLGENNYNATYKEDYEGSRINVILESEIFGDVDFLPFHQAEGYGFFRKMELDENPGSRDIVLYDALPNSLPRVGGIITSVVQTPLSHVNLRAIQDDVPNAYIREPLMVDSIASLLNNYIYYRVEADNYVIREASLEEVNEWYESIRPTEEQIPDRDLSFTQILPLDSIHFGMSTAFGAKCTNVATMRKMGFPEGTIPQGFGIPFYYYDEFMKFNNFYDRVEEMIQDPQFISDLETRIDMLKDFRDDIKDASLPQWMLDELQEMHDAFPEGTSVRCRSSTNNEDLPGFSGAGLYTSKTQHPDEGHISKSVKQVYASMWNFRAYDERDFYRIDHSIAAMGILCHPNYEEEKSNGVGVSLDPIYETANTFYLNTQVGEFLITNPDENSIPEEILLSEDPAEGFVVLRESNLVEHGSLVMEEKYLDSMRIYLKVIHEEFAKLYDVVGAEGFGMDIEYKVTAEDQLIIKQARPWVSFWADIKATFDLEVTEITSPITSPDLGDSEIITTNIRNSGLRDMSDFELSLFIDDQLMETMLIGDTLKTQESREYNFTIPQDFSIIGEYKIMTSVSHPEDGYRNNDSLIVLVNKLNQLEGGITIGQSISKCGNELEVQAIITNYGAQTFSLTEIEVVVNGDIVDTIIYDYNIPYLATVEIDILITENLQEVNNEIQLNLLRVNGEKDAVDTNNSSVVFSDLVTTHDFITFVINTDQYPNENSWDIYDELKEEVIASGDLEDFSGDVYSVDVCVDYSSCLTLNFYDSFGDGICCEWGEGNFYVLNSLGDTLVFNDGNVGFGTNEFFCPNGEGCAFVAEVIVTNTSDENIMDGIIEIQPPNETESFLYSIDGGETFFINNVFMDLDTGVYMVVVQNSTETCIYEETVVIQAKTPINSEDFVDVGIQIYPNPTDDLLIIAFDSELYNTNNIEIEIYDCLGRKIIYKTPDKLQNDRQLSISLLDQSAGTYFVKCRTNLQEHFLRIVKL